MTGLVGAVPVAADEIEALGQDLAATGSRAHRAVWRLSAAPAHAVPYLRGVLKPVPEADGRRVGRLIADLDDDRFTVRTKAARELEQLGESAAEALRKELQTNPSLELRRRIEALLDRLDGPGMAPELLRALRGIEALEHAGTAEARQVLESLARGAEGARQTREARAALERLAQK